MRFVISGPSGSGKTTIIRMLKKELMPIKFSVSATDRSSRPDEVDGINYYFLSREEFQWKIDHNEFLEYVELENRYGTLWSEIENTSDDIILDLDVTGALKIREHYPDAVLIFIAPPSMEELERRLRDRNDGMTESELQQRLIRAERELACTGVYDYVIINDSLQEAFEDVLSVIEKNRKNNDPHHNCGFLRGCGFVQNLLY